MASSLKQRAHATYNRELALERAEIFRLGILNSRDVRELSEGLCDALHANAPSEYANAHLGPVDLSDSKNHVSLAHILEKGCPFEAGKFLLCRAILPSRKATRTDIQVLVDDEDGEYAVEIVLPRKHITFHNTNCSWQEVKTDAIAAGTIMALLHPYFTMNSTNLMGFACKNPASHLVILGKQHPLMARVNFKIPLASKKLAEDFSTLEPKEAGLKYFAVGNYAMAAECFSQALSRETDAVLKAKQHANLALLLLISGRYDDALVEAENGLKLDPNNIKTVQRFAKALFFLQRYEECANFIENGCHEIETVEELKLLLNQARTAQIESKTGSFNFEAMTGEAAKSPYLEGHASFLSPSLLLNRLDIAANTDISAGSVLLAEKAFVFVKSAEDDDDITATLCSKLSICNDKDRDSFFSLAPTNFQATFAKCWEENIPRHVLGNFQPFYKLKHIAEEFHLVCSKDGAVGLWLMASRIERTNVKSSATNCKCHFIGDYIVVEATRDVKSGERLSMAKFSS